MFLLMLKTEKNAGTTLNFVGMYPSKERAERHVGVEYMGLKESGFGNYRMLGGSADIDAKAVWETSLWQGSRYLLAEY